MIFDEIMKWVCDQITSDGIRTIDFPMNQFAA